MKTNFSEKNKRTQTNGKTSMFMDQKTAVFSKMSKLTKMMFIIKTEYFQRLKIFSSCCIFFHCVLFKEDDQNPIKKLYGIYQVQGS